MLVVKPTEDEGKKPNKCGCKERFKGNYWARSGKDGGAPGMVKDHLHAVAELAAENARAWEGEDEGRLAGYLHDLGKYGDLFQCRIRGRGSGIDHWTAGASVALKSAESNGIAAAIAVQGHHIGLQRVSRRMLEELFKGDTPSPLGQNKRLSGEVEVVRKRFLSEGLEVPTCNRSIFDYSTRTKKSVASMMDIRMLFSALVDADYTDAGAHDKIHAEKCDHQDNLVSLRPKEVMGWLDAFISKLQASGLGADSVQQVRTELYSQAIAGASNKPGVFTLTAPTGAGKTLAMLAFAMKHAKRYGHRRIVSVLPYISIIEQTAAVYRQVVEPHLGEGVNRYILEDHCLVDPRGKGDIHPDLASESAKASETWDAPLVVTTSVRFFESLFANRGKTCRKLHNLAGSILLFDEVQTLPNRLVVPILAALARLVERYGVTVVFSTATQPAFSHLSDKVKGLGGVGWKPKEIVSSGIDMFQRLSRVSVEWPEKDVKKSWTEVAEWLYSEPQALAIVNKRDHATKLFLAVQDMGCEGLLHISTNLCPLHRKKVLKDVVERLRLGEPCRLVSTQCVEAGVDLDFPFVCRSWGPLDSMAQAAGRCNRGGNLERGTVRLFFPKDDGRRPYPSATYEQAADVALGLLRKGQIEGHQIQLDSPSLYAEYFKDLYRLAGDNLTRQDLIDALKSLDFPRVNDNFRLIQDGSISVLVPYCEEAELLAKEVREDRLSRDWIRRARPFSVGVWVSSRKEMDTMRYMEKAPMRDGSYSDEWWIHLEPDHYDDNLGLVLPDVKETLIL